MKIDIHCHATGSGRDITNADNDVYFNPRDNNTWFTRILYNMVEKDIKKMNADEDHDGKISTKEYFSLIYNYLKNSTELDGIVLLALDAVYFPETGLRDDKKTDLWVTNKFLCKKVQELNDRLQKEKDPQVKKKKFFLGASVNPNRKDWMNELDYVIEETGAVLLKLIPSTQHIRLADSRHEEFYRRLAGKKLPLLCHVGPEYSFPEGIREQELDNYKYLKKAIECGVTVIAAHCASPVFPVIDKNVMKKFNTFMKAANSDGKIRLWSDTSALSLSTRLPYIPEILKTFNPDWLVHGSDFPIPVDAWPHLPLVTKNISPKEYIRICKTKNPFDRDVRIKRAHGFSNRILINSQNILRW